jgi:hypothetical protein
LPLSISIAHADSDETTIYLDGGERIHVPIQFAHLSASYSHDIIVHLKGEGSLEGYDIRTSGRRRSGPSCDFDLGIYEPGESTPLESTIFYDMEWTNWFGAYDLGDYDSIIIRVKPSTECSNDPGSVEIAIALDGEPVSTPEPIVLFWPDEDHIRSGQCTYLNWNVENASEIRLDPESVNVYGQRQVCPPATTTYILSVADYDGSWTKYPKTIYIEEAPESVIDFWADNYNINEGDCTYLNWDVSNASGVYLDGSSYSQSSYEYVCPSKTTTYTLEVYGNDGQLYSVPLTIYVEEEEPLPPEPSSISFWADDYKLVGYGCTELHWDVLNAERVKLDGDDTGGEIGIHVCPGETKTYVLEVLGEDGAWTKEELTILVEEEVHEDRCDPSREATNYILFVTDSNELAESTNTSDAWEQIQPRLEKLYHTYAEGCMGIPVFLNLAELYPDGRYFWPQVGAAIQDTIHEKMGGFYPGAVTIIGGPDVVPMAELENAADDETLYTDDVHVDFNEDRRHLPDVVITRVPDGHDINLIQNHISAFMTERVNKVAPEGMTVLSGLSYSLEKTVYGYQDTLLLSDILERGEGNYTHLVSPPWGTAGYDDRFETEFADIIPDQDVWNDNPPQNEIPLNVQNLLFLLNKPAGQINNSYWSAVDPRMNKLQFVFSVDQVKKIGGLGGWHVFSTAGHAADLASGNQTPENSITLQFLFRGAHHFIGSTTETYLVYSACRKVGSNATQICHYELTGATGLLIQQYYRTRSEDPATSFWASKFSFADQMNPASPYDYKTLHSFHYFGLVTPGPQLGSRRQVSRIGKEDLSHRAAEICPSQIPDDCDGDGISNEEEMWVAQTFVPKYYFAKGELALHGYYVYQISPQKVAGTEGVVLMVLALYDQDYVFYHFKNIDLIGLPMSFMIPVAMPIYLGSRIVHSYTSEEGSRDFMHYGDNEVIEIWLARRPGFDMAPSEGVATYHDPQRESTAYQVERISIHRHHDTVEYGPRDVGWISTHPEVFVSEGKHGTYVSYKECRNAVANLITDTGYGNCDINFHWNPLKTVKEIGICVGRQGEAFLGSIKGLAQAVTWRELCSTASESMEYGMASIPVLRPENNVGERDEPLFINMEDNPYLAPVFPYESVWDDEIGRFCGGYREYVPDPDAFASLPLLEWAGKVPFIDEKICTGPNDSKWCPGTTHGYCGYWGE